MLDLLSQHFFETKCLLSQNETQSNIKPNDNAQQKTCAAGYHTLFEFRFLLSKLRSDRAHI